jgi:hypothetical protein
MMSVRMIQQLPRPEKLRARFSGSFNAWFFYFIVVNNE